MSACHCSSLPADRQETLQERGPSWHKHAAYAGLLVSLPLTELKELMRVEHGRTPYSRGLAARSMPGTGQPYGAIHWFWSDKRSFDARAFAPWCFRIPRTQGNGISPRGEDRNAASKLQTSRPGRVPEARLDTPSKRGASGDRFNAARELAEGAQPAQGQCQRVGDSDSASIGEKSRFQHIRRWEVTAANVVRDLGRELELPTVACVQRRTGRTRRIRIGQTKPVDGTVAGGRATVSDQSVVSNRRIAT